MAGIKPAPALILVHEITMLDTLKNNWPEYLIEAWGLGTFMVSACGFGVFLFHRDSYFADRSMIFRNAFMGIAMGTTAIGIFKSPWGQRSGAHINPVVTLTFFRLGKISGADALFYAAAQFVGGVMGVFVAWVFLGDLLKAVNFVPTVPGVYGMTAAFIGEVVIAFLMMLMVLYTGNHAKFYKYTPFIAGLFIAVYIMLESPISGMSMNPARTFASAIMGDTWTAWWIYFTAPTIAMLVAAEVYVRTKRPKAVLCAKLDHSASARCIFNCDFGRLAESATEHTEIDLRQDSESLGFVDNSAKQL